VIAVLNALKKTDAAAMRVVAVAAFSGLRKSEIQGLRWEDLKDEEIHLQRTAWRSTKVEEGAKTEASLGAAPRLKVLRKHIETHRDGRASNGFVFVGGTMGKPLDLHNLANRVIRCAGREEHSVVRPAWLPAWTGEQSSRPRRG
jgi:integrase